MTTDSWPVRHAPVLVDPRSTWLTYENFYGLAEKPFSLSSDPRFFYHSSSHASAFDDLLAGIRRRESLSVLTGDIGMGKTTLCRSVIQSLDRRTFSAIVPDPFASREDLLKVLLMDFGVMSTDDLTSGRLKGASRTELSYLLYEFLETLAPLQAFAVVIIDEAQNLSVPLLEEIRILSDSDGRDRQLQVVLVGQLELREKLMLPEMRQVDQRISVRSTLEGLNREGVAGYVAHRLQVAGGSPDRVSFSRDALDLVHLKSGGVPRLINRICDRALHEGYLRRAACIDPEHLESALPGTRQATSAIASDSVSTAPHTVTRSSDGLDAKFDFLPETDADDKPVGLDPVRSVPGPTAQEWARQGGVLFPRVIPPTYLQRVSQRWARRLGIAALGVMALGVIGFALVGLQDLRVELAAPPQLPDLPAAPPYPAMPAALTVPALPDAETSDTPL